MDAHEAVALPSGIPRRVIGDKSAGPAAQKTFGPRSIAARPKREATYPNFILHIVSAHIDTSAIIILNWFCGLKIREFISGGGGKWKIASSEICRWKSSGSSIPSLVRS
jgi:hypothetical protein